jgi:hypothetical protein
MNLATKTYACISLALKLESWFNWILKDDVLKLQMTWQMNKLVRNNVRKANNFNKSSLEVSVSRPYS